MLTKSQGLIPPATARVSGILRSKEWSPGRASTFAETMTPAEMKKAIKKAERDRPELELAQQLVASRLLPYSPQFKFHPTRDWRFDFAFPDIRFAVECNGGLYVNGGHSRGKAVENDYERAAEAIMLGWTLMNVSPKQIKQGLAIGWIEKVVRDRRRG